MSIKTQNTRNTLRYILQAIDLSDKEATLYEMALNTGTSTASKLAKVTGLKRGITYAALAKLIEQGLMLQSTRQGSSHFTAIHPQTLKEKIQQKQQELTAVGSLLDQHLPRLARVYKTAIGKPVVRFFEGEQGIMEVFERIYAPKDEPVYGCVDLDIADRVFPDYIVNKLIPKRVKNGVLAITILPATAKTQNLQKSDLKQLRKSSLIDAKKYPLPAEIDVWGDTVALMTFKDGEYIAMLIEQPDIATTMRSLMKLAHRQGQGVERED